MGPGCGAKRNCPACLLTRKERSPRALDRPLAFSLPGTAPRVVRFAHLQIAVHGPRGAVCLGSPPCTVHARCMGTWRLVCALKLERLEHARGPSPSDPCCTRRPPPPIACVKSARWPVVVLYLASSRELGASQGRAGWLWRRRQRTTPGRYNTIALAREAASKPCPACAHASNLKGAEAGCALDASLQSADTHGCMRSACKCGKFAGYLSF